MPYTLRNGKWSRSPVLPTYTGTVQYAESTVGSTPSEPTQLSRRWMREHGGSMRLKTHALFQDSPLFTLQQIVGRSTAIGTAHGFTLDSCRSRVVDDQQAAQRFSPHTPCSDGPPAPPRPPCCDLRSGRWLDNHRSDIATDPRTRLSKVCQTRVDLPWVQFGHRNTPEWPVEPAGRAASDL